MGIANINDFMARIEQAVRTNLRGAQVIAAIKVEETIRVKPSYWERIYIVAWEREDQCGTHRVNIDSDDQSACFIGHYDMKTEKEAIDDMIKRAGR